MGEVTDALRRAAREREQGIGPPETNIESARVPAPIAAFREEPSEARAVLGNLSGPPVDRFRHFALQVRRSLDARGARSVLITSALESEGKTLVTCNLALALASMAGEHRIALLDLDLHHPSVATTFGVEPGPGIETVLLGKKDLRSARVRTDLPALDLYPIARSVSRPHEVLARPSFRALIHDLSREYSTVVCDSPPALPAPDVELIAPHVGACVLVAKAGFTRRLAFREMMKMLPRENLIGTFLNFSSPPRHERNYARYVERYGDKDERAEFLDEVEAAPGDTNRHSISAENNPREPLGPSDD